MASETATLSKALSDAEVFLSQIRELAGGDEDFISDLVEGETDILELIAKVDASEVEDQALVIGIDAMIDKLEARKRAAKARIETKRALLANALSLIGKKTHKTPLGTLTVSMTAPTAIVTDESAIPSRFWRQPAPVLDKAALNAAVKYGEDIAGATKSNGGVKLTIRR